MEFKTIIGRKVLIRIIERDTQFRDSAVLFTPRQFNDPLNVVSDMGVVEGLGVYSTKRGELRTVSELNLGDVVMYDIAYGGQYFEDQGHMYCILKLEDVLLRKEN